MTFVKKFVTEFDNVADPVPLYKSIITFFRQPTLSQTDTVKTLLNKKAYKKAYPEKSEDDRFSDFITFIINQYVGDVPSPIAPLLGEPISNMGDVPTTLPKKEQKKEQKKELVVNLTNNFASAFVKYFTDSQEDAYTAVRPVFDNGSYAKIIDAINRVLLPKGDAQVYDLESIENEIDSPYYGAGILKMSFTIANGTDTNINNQKVHLIADSNDYYIYEALEFNPEQAQILENILNSCTCTLHKSHYYNIDVLKRCQSADEMLTILNSLQLTSYIGKYNESLPEDDEDRLKMRNAVRGMSNVYEDIVNDVIGKVCVFESSSDDNNKHLCLYFCTNSNKVLESLRDSFTIEPMNSIEEFVKVWFSKDDCTFSSLL